MLLLMISLYPYMKKKTFDRNPRKGINFILDNANNIIFSISYLIAIGNHVSNRYRNVDK